MVVDIAAMLLHERMADINTFLEVKAKVRRSYVRKVGIRGLAEAQPCARACAKDNAVPMTMCVRVIAAVVGDVGWLDADISTMSVPGQAPDH